MTKHGFGLAMGIVATILGLLILLGEFTVAWLVPVLGIALVVIGVLMLTDVIGGGTPLGVIALVGGVLLMIPLFDVPMWLARGIDVIVGVLLIIFGVVTIAGADEGVAARKTRT